MKKIIIGLFVVAASSVSQAAYLYWQIDTPQTAANTGGAINFTEASVWAVNGDKKVELKLANDSGQTMARATLAVAGQQATINLNQLEGYTSYSYYIELYRYNGSKFENVGLTTAQTYTEMVNAGFIDTGLTPITPASTSIWHGGGTVNAPEPTSAMLMLLGVAGLALRRKQRKLA